MLELHLDPWPSCPRALWPVVCSVLVLIASLLVFCLPKLLDADAQTQSLSYTVWYPLIHAIRNGFLATATVWIGLGLRKSKGIAHPWLMVLALLIVGVGGELAFDWAEPYSRQQYLTYGGDATTAQAIWHLLGLIDPFTPFIIWPLAGAAAIFAGGKPSQAESADAYRLALLAQVLTLAAGMALAMHLTQMTLIKESLDSFALLNDNGNDMMLTSLLLLVPWFSVPILLLWPARLRHANSLLLALLGLIIAILPGAPALVLLSIANGANSDSLFGWLLWIMLGSYALGVPFLAGFIGWLHRTR